jgi:hypothetical protein
MSFKLKGKTMQFPINEIDTPEKWLDIKKQLYEHFYNFILPKRREQENKN